MRRALWDKPRYLPLTQKSPNQLVEAFAFLKSTQNYNTVFEPKVPPAFSVFLVADQVGAAQPLM